MKLCLRLVLPALAVLALVSEAPTAEAASITFGGGSLSNPCSTSGNSADRSCTASATSGASSFNVRGQASADHGLTTNATAIADMTITYSIPYTVTRTVTVDPALGPYPINAAFEDVQLVFNGTYSGRTAADNSQVGGGLGNAVAYDATFSSASGYFGATNWTGSSAIQSGSNGFNDTGPDPTFSTTLNFSGPAWSEGTTDANGLPTDMRAWSDFVAPYQADYTTVFQVVQSITDTLQVTFRLRAESRPSGSVSSTGGEAIACAGLTSPLGAFDLDNGLNCGTGFTVNASAQVTGTTNIAVPEPAVLALVGAGLAGLAALGVRRRR
jgi:hypothetical protein